MISLEEFVLNAIAFVKRFLLTYWSILFRSRTVFQSLLSEYGSSTKKDNENRDFTNPHVFFIVSIILLAASYKTLISLREFYNPLGFWREDFGKLLHRFSYAVFENSSFESFIYVIPISIIFYIVFSILSVLLFDSGKERRVFYFSFLYWVGAVFLTYLIIFFALPNILFKTGIDLKMMDHIVSILNVVNGVFFLVKPNTSISRYETFDSFFGLRYTFVGIMAFSAIFSYNQLYYKISDSISAQPTEYYFLNQDNESKLSICLHSNNDSTALYSNLLLINNSSYPIYIKSHFSFHASIYEEYYQSATSLHFNLINVKSSQTLYRRIEANSMEEMSFKSEVDCDTLKQLLSNKEKFYYEVTFLAIIEGDAKILKQLLRLNCGREEFRKGCKCY